MKRKGLSPVIATVLLIAIVVVIASIVLLWFRGITEESVTKFGKKNIKLVCDDVQFQASYSSGIISISNTGTIPIYNIKVKIVRSGSFATEDFKTPKIFGDVGWPSSGINQGEAFETPDISTFITDANELLLIPVLIGSSKKGDTPHTCEERHGYKITL